MIFLRCHALGFGRLKDAGFDFAEGLNLVFAPNEAGKSTLQRFLIAMLYGQLRPENKLQRRLDPWVDSFRPWSGQDYAGNLWLRLAGGKELEIHRTFGKDEARVVVRTSSGEEITRSYEQQRNGEVLFARTHLGLPKELFESIAIIRENRAADLDGTPTLRDRIANLAQSGAEDLSVQTSLQLLLSEIDAVGSDRAPTRPYRQCLDRIQMLIEEKNLLDQKRRDYEGWLQERSRLGAEVAAHETKLRKARAALARARWREAAGEVRLLEELVSEMESTRREVESSPGRIDFPDQYLEEVNEASGVLKSLGQRLEDIGKEIAIADAGLKRAASARETLAGYGALLASGEADKVSGWFVGYLRLATYRDEAQRLIGRQREEMRETREKLGRLGTAFADPSIDWQARAMEAAERERKGAEEILQISDKITAQKSILARWSTKARRLRLAGILTAAAAVVLLAAWILAGQGILPSWVVLGLTALLAAGSVSFLVAASSAGRMEKEIVHAIAIFEAARSHVREESQKPQIDIETSMREAGFDSMDEFLASAKQVDQRRQKAADLEARIQEMEGQRDSLAAECTELFGKLQVLLAQAGLSVTPGVVKAQVDIFRENLRKFRDLDESYRQSLQKLEALQAQEAELRREAAEKEQRLSLILAEAGVESPEKYREGCESRRRLIDLNEREAARLREFLRHAGSQTLDQWKEALKELELQKDATAALAEASAPDAGSPAGSAGPLLLPYEPSFDEAEAEDKKISGLLAAAREDYARLVERVRHAFHNCREASEIEEDLAQEESRLRRLEQNRKSLELAVQTIQALSREQQEVLAPQLNMAVAQRFVRLSQGRYREVKVDPDFNVWVREGEAGDLRNAESLSRGTRDQLYLALRFGILDLVADGEESCPSLLDEPCSAYDRVRMAEAFQVLAEESARRQLIVFTCREDMRDMAEAHRARILEIPNPSSGSSG